MLDNSHSYKLAVNDKLELTKAAGDMWIAL